MLVHLDPPAPATGLQLTEKGRPAPALSGECVRFVFRSSFWQDPGHFLGPLRHLLLRVDDLHVRHLLLWDRAGEVVVLHLNSRDIRRYLVRHSASEVVVRY